MTYLGDFAEDATVSFEFNAYNNLGVPAALSGTLTECVSVYKSGSTTAHTQAYTPAVLDSKTGLYRLTIDMSANAFFSVDTDYAAVITGAGVTNADGTSVVNTKIATWSCHNRAAELPDGSITADTFATGVLATDEEVATAVWAALTASNTTSGSFGELVGGIVDSLVKRFGVTLTVSADPTTTSFTVSSTQSLTNTQADNALLLHLKTGRYTRITNISGTAITVSPALPAAPDVADEVVVFGQYLASL